MSSTPEESNDVTLKHAVPQTMTTVMMITKMTMITKMMMMLMMMMINKMKTLPQKLISLSVDTSILASIRPSHELYKMVSTIL